MNLASFLPLLFAPFLRGKQGFCPALAPGWPEKHGGYDVCAFFLAKRREKRVRCDIFGPNAAGHKLVMPLFLGGVRVFCSQEEQEEERREEGEEEEDS